MCRRMLRESRSRATRLLLCVAFAMALTGCCNSSDLRSGSFMAYAEGANLFVSLMDGNKPTLLTTLPIARIEQISWSPPSTWSTTEPELVVVNGPDVVVVGVKL